MKIILDLDCIVADFFTPLVEEYNNLTGEGISIATFTKWEMSELVKHPKVLIDVFHTRGFFLNLRPLPGALEAVKELQADGHEFMVVTSPSTPHSAEEKVIWMDKYLPKMPYLIGKNKSWVLGDVLIDDNAGNAVNSLAPVAITIAYPYNVDVAYDFRAPDYNDTAKAWESMVKYIKGIA